MTSNTQDQQINKKSLNQILDDFCRQQCKIIQQLQYSLSDKEIALMYISVILTYTQLNQNNLNNLAKVLETKANDESLKAFSE